MVPPPTAAGSASAMCSMRPDASAGSGVSAASRSASEFSTPLRWPTGDQAREVFDVARNMALREPEFLARFGVDCGKHDITIPGTASSFKPLNAEGSTLDGLNIHGCVVDELHAHKTRAVWDVLDSATGFMMISKAAMKRMYEAYREELYAVNDIVSPNDTARLTLEESGCLTVFKLQGRA